MAPNRVKCFTAGTDPSDIARAIGGEVRLNDEAEEFRWLSPAAALAMDRNQPTRILLEECLQRQFLP